MLSPGHPTPFSGERVVVRQLNFVFGKSKPAQKESAMTGRETFHITGDLGLFWWSTKKSDRLSKSNESQRS
jgi:hypothetical protein